ncbi:MAG: translocation/assembly module TamB domain-containing protein [Methylophilaceae bacterium]
MIKSMAWLLACCAMVMATPLHAASISVTSSIADISYDVGAVHLQLEQLDSRMRLTPTLEGKLLVENLQAQRLVVTFRESAAAATPQPAKSSGLPDRISLPLAITVRQARITQLKIITASATHIIDNVQLNLEADSKRIRLELLQAITPWGEARMQLELGNHKPYPLKGFAQLTQTKGAQRYAIRTLLSGDLQRIQFSTAGLLQRQAEGMAIVLPDAADIDPKQTAGIFQLQGHIGIADSQPLEAHATLRQLKPELLGMRSGGLFNLTLDVAGQFSPQPKFALKLQSMDSLWQGVPLVANASLQYVDQRMQQIQLLATLADNKISASGSLGGPDDVLQWQAELPTLASLGREFGGKAQASGELRGALDELSIKFQLLADGLRTPGALYIGKLQGQGQLGAGLQGELHGDISASGIRRGQDNPFNAHATLNGTRQQHQLTFNADGLDLQLKTTLQGGLVASGGWQGQLRQLSYKSNTSAILEAPASLSYSSADGLNVSKLALKLQQGHFYIDQLHHAGAALSTQGRLAQVGLRDIPGLSLPQEIKGNPTFSGKWDLRLADKANGAIHLRHDSGDLEFTGAGNSRQVLGLQQVQADITLDNNNVRFSARLNGTKLGQLHVQAATRLTATPSGFDLRGDAPLSLDIQSSLHTLSWLSMLPPLADASIDGQLSAALKGDGTIRHPGLRGSINGQQLHVVLPSEGVNLTSGVLQASLQDDSMRIQQLQFSGGQGTLSASGQFTLVQQQVQGELNWVLHQFTALSRTDRLLVLDGKLTTAMRDNILDVSGDLKVLGGLIELPKADLPTLDNDVVVIGRTEQASSSPLNVNISGLRIDFGQTPAGNVDWDKQFVVRGRGIDAYLTGALTLSGNTTALRGEGSIEAHGTYLAYGQVLDIERGVINFSGPLDSPGLNIRAMRSNQAVKAGVEVTGNVLLPTVKLVSTPNVPDSDKLSWLVLGHGADEAGNNEFAMLSLAAGALFSKDESVPLQTRLARSAGLDTFSISGSDAKSSSVNLGKRLSSRLYLSYEKSLTGLLNVARLTYQINKHWSLRTQAGSESAVDVLYTFSFK